MKKQQLFIVKIGGNIIRDEQKLTQFLKDFSKIPEPKIVIHGGGKSATELSSRLGVKTEMIDGRRITSLESLKVVVMTYAGLLNKTIVTGLQKYNCDAIGLSGADGNLILSRKRAIKTIDYGYVGDIVAVNEEKIKRILELGLTPVFCGITHNAEGQLFNSNADTIASEIAIAMSKNYEVSLCYCFELNGVLENIQDKSSVIENMNLEKYTALKEAKVISDGMLPKLQNCFNALQKNVSKVQIASVEFIKDKTIQHTNLSL